MAKILIVDEDENIFVLYHAYLTEDFGHTTLFAVGPDEAINVLKKDKDIDLVILGGNMYVPFKEKFMKQRHGHEVANFICNILWPSQGETKRPLFVTAGHNLYRAEGAAGVFTKNELMKNFSQAREKNWINRLLRENGIEVPPAKNLPSLPDKRPAP